MDLLEEIIKIKINKLGFLWISILFFLNIFFVGILWLLFPPGYKEFVRMFPVFLKTLLALGGFILFFTILLKFFHKVQPFLNFYKWNKKLPDIPDIEQWIYQGCIVIGNNQTGKTLKITSSNSGALIKDFLYKNFELSCKLKIENGGGIGIVFRAQDLENYLMLQIGIWDDIQKDWGDKIVVTPHIRFLGNFETFNIDKREPFFYFKNLKFDNLSNESLSVKLKVSGDIVKLSINNEEFIWNIPTHVEPNIVQRPGDNGTRNQPKSDPLNKDSESKLWFRNDYGMIGFRAYGLEKADIMCLDVKKL